MSVSLCASGVSLDCDGAGNGNLAPLVVNAALFGAVGDGTTNGQQVPINAAIVYASRTGGEAIVYVPSGKYLLSGTINLLPNVSLWGAGSAAYPNAGTEFAPGPAYVGDGIVLTPSAGLWHHASLMRLQTRGFTGYGIKIAGDGMGENAVIDEVSSNNNTLDGICITGSVANGATTSGGGTPNMVGRISVHSNGGAGLLLQSLQSTHTQVLYVGGDDNAESLITVENIGAAANVRIVGWKSERHIVGGHPVVLLAKDCNGGVIDFGYGRVNNETTASADAVVKVITSSAYVKYLFVYFGTANGYAFDFNDVPAGQTVAFGGSERKEKSTISLCGPVITPPSNSTSLLVSGYSLTGANAQPMLDLSGTVNASGTPTVIKLTVTATQACGLLDLRTGAGSMFYVGSDGSVFSGGGITSGGNLGVGANAFFGWSTRSFMQSPADGDIFLQSNNGTTFRRLQFGGTGTAHPSWGRNGTTLEAKLADGSAFSPVSAGVVNVAADVATPANGSTAARLLFGTTAGFGIYYGSGAPSVSAGTGSLYLRSDGVGTTSRAYSNTTGGTTWTPLVTVT